MTVRISQLKPGDIVRHPDHRTLNELTEGYPWYRVQSVNPGEVLCSNVKSGSPKTFKGSVATALVLASESPRIEFDLSCIIGRKVVLTVAHGMSSGTVTRIQMSSFKLGGRVVAPAVIPYPTEIVLDGEPWPLREVRKIELVD